jgi:hypothetical protein
VGWLIGRGWLHRKALLTWDSLVCEQRIVSGEGLTLKVAQPIKACRPFEVSADGKGMTARAGLGLVAQLTDRVGANRRAATGDRPVPVLA